MPKTNWELIGEDLKREADEATARELAQQPATYKKTHIKAFAREVLASSEYRRSLRDRIYTHTLPPAVEVKLYEYAYGKPKERVEIEEKTTPLEQMTPEQAHRRLLVLAEFARNLAKKDESQQKIEDDDWKGTIQ